jgi:hypothetical protein
MEGWLASFQSMGLIRIGEGKIMIVRHPNAGEIEIAARAAGKAAKPRD